MIYILRHDFPPPFDLAIKAEYADDQASSRIRALSVARIDSGFWWFQNRGHAEERVGESLEGRRHFGRPHVASLQFHDGLPCSALLCSWHRRRMPVPPTIRSNSPYSSRIAGAGFRRLLRVSFSEQDCVGRAPFRIRRSAQSVRHDIRHFIKGSAAHVFRSVSACRVRTFIGVNGRFRATRGQTNGSSHAYFLPAFFAGTASDLCSMLSTRST